MQKDYKLTDFVHDDNVVQGNINTKVIPFIKYHQFSDKKENIN